jgi:alpha-L-fucosidase
MNMLKKNVVNAYGAFNAFMVSIVGCAEKNTGEREIIMRKIKLFGLVVSLVLCGTSFSVDAKEQIGATRKDYKWWSEARFGVFIHWGVGSSVYRHGLQRQGPPKGQPSDIAKKLPVPEDIHNGKYLEWRNKGGKVPYLIYDNLYRVFNPEKFNAEEWVKTFKAAGAGYIIFTSRHHDGFCMWNTKTTDYNIMNSPYKRDICKELADACHKYNMPLLWYFSILDLYDSRYDFKNPKPFEKVLFGQVHELLTNYGKIAGVWWDGGNIKYDRKKMCEMIRECQPGAIYNGRAWGGKYGLPFNSPEQRLGSFDMDRPWETCAVIHDGLWFWNGGKNIKSVNMCLGMLVDCASGDGNLALDFGPCPDGTIFPTIKERYLGMGQWLKKYGETIYKTRGGPYKPGLWGGSTRNGNNVYLHITQRWPGGVLKLPALPAKVRSCMDLTGGEA